MPLYIIETQYNMELNLMQQVNFLKHFAEKIKRFYLS